MSIKKLAGETAIYGGAHISGKLINFLLLYVHTDIFPADKFGIQTFIYSIIPFLSVLFTYRIEVAYFRYGSDKEMSESSVYTTTAISVFVSTLLFGGVLALFIPSLLSFTTYADYESLFFLALFILCIDSVNSVFYAKLRLDSRPLKFALAQLGGIIITVLMNLVFFYYLPQFSKNEWISFFYNPEYGIGYIFVANLFGSLISFLILSPLITKIQWRSFDWTIWKKMIHFAAPLILVGLSFVVNELFDRLVIPTLAPGETQAERDTQLGIYGAMYKLTMFIALFRQAFQYAGEPFFFHQKTAENAKQIYADIAKFFTIIVSAGFLFILLYLDILKYLIANPTYWQGLHIVPILLMANLLLGVYYTFSVWYKITDRTIWGAYISLGGAAITVVINLLFIPKFGYVAAAWATLAAYGAMTIASYVAGQRFYKIPYQTGRIIAYIGFAWLGYAISTYIKDWVGDQWILGLAFNSLIMLGYFIMVVQLEWKTIQQYFLRTKLG